MPRRNIAAFGGWGLHLFDVMAARLRSAWRDVETEAPDYRTGPVPAGPDFVYESAPGLFHSRMGRGPLFIAWDTNLLVDYFQFGRKLWEGGHLPDGLDEEHGSELEGLQLLIALWVLRDIRFMILPGTVTDAKKKLSQSRQVDPDQVLQRGRDGGVVEPDGDQPRAACNAPDHGSVQFFANPGLGRRRRRDHHDDGVDGVEAFLEQLLDEAVARPDLPDVQPRRDAHLRELARERLDEIWLVLAGMREEGPHG